MVQAPSASGGHGGQHDATQLVRALRSSEQPIKSTRKIACSQSTPPSLSLLLSRTDAHILTTTHLRTYPKPQAFSPPLPPSDVAGPVSGPPVLSPVLSIAEGVLGWTSNPPPLTHMRTPSRTQSVTVHATCVCQA